MVLLSTGLVGMSIGFIAPFYVSPNIDGHILRMMLRGQKRWLKVRCAQLEGARERKKPHWQVNLSPFSIRRRKMLLQSKSATASKEILSGSCRSCAPPRNGQCQNMRSWKSGVRPMLWALSSGCPSTTARPQSLKKVRVQVQKSWWRNLWRCKWSKDWRIDGWKTFEFHLWSLKFE